jgi:hypothetical protein
VVEALARGSGGEPELREAMDILKVSQENDNNSTMGLWTTLKLSFFLNAGLSVCGAQCACMTLGGSSCSSLIMCVKSLLLPTLLSESCL